MKNSIPKRPGKAMPSPPRTDAEIVARVKEGLCDDFLGWSTSDLIDCLPFEAAKPFLIKGATKKEWGMGKPGFRSREQVIERMRDYMPFAIEKAIDHRGLSASRSIEHFTSWVWLLGDADYKSVNWDRHANYGCPALLQICKLYGFQSSRKKAFRLMAAGRKCSARCTGCR
jgi:hypothetical protein